MSVVTEGAMGKAGIEKGISPYWSNMFVPPMEIRDTPEYEYIEYQEVQNGGSDIGENWSVLRFYNRDVDPYLYFRKAVLRLRGQLTNDASPPVAVADGAQVTMVNLGQFGIFSKAELRFESTLVEKNNNPLKNALVKALTRFSDDHVRSQGTISFFYKDGPGKEGVIKKYSLVGTVVTENGQATKYLGIGSAAGASRDVLASTAGNPALTDDPTYNEGFHKRYNLTTGTTPTTTARFVELFVPLAYLFGFYEAHDFPFRGLRHEILLYKNSVHASYMHKAAGTAGNHRFKLLHQESCNGAKTVLNREL